MMDVGRSVLNKVPPYSVHSEKVVLASLLRTPPLIREVKPLITDGSAFFRPEHGRLYDALLTAAGTKPPATTDDLIKKISFRTRLEKLGGEEQLRELAKAGEEAEALKSHVQIVLEKARMRQLIDAISDILHDAYHSTDGFEDIHTRAKQRLADLGKKQAKRTH